MPGFRSPLNVFVILTLLGISTDSQAGTTTCNTVASGNWNDPATWNCTTGTGLPATDSFVTILDTHTVTLDVDASVTLLVVNPGGDLDVAASPGGLTLAWTSDSSDISQASIDLAGDLTISTETTAPRDLLLGSVDGGFNLTLRAEGNTLVSGALGGNTPIASLMTDGGGFVTLTANVTTTGVLDISEPLVIAGDVRVAAQSITLDGNIDADQILTDRNLTLAANTVSQIIGDVGSVVPLNQLSVEQSTTVQFIEGNITTTNGQEYQTLLVTRVDTNLTGSLVEFRGGLESETLGAGHNVTVTGNALFGSVIIRDTEKSGFSNPESITVTGDTSISFSGSGIIATNGFQDYQGSMTLNSDVMFTSVNGGNIDIGDSGGAFDLTVNTAGTTFFRGTIGSPRHTSITTNAGGNTRLSGLINIMVDGSTPTTFNDQLNIGASGRVTVDQAGSGDVIFNGPIIQLSGSPHRLTVNDVSGQTVFNNTVSIGTLTTNDGAGNDVTVINTNQFQTDQGGANNGVMTLNDPVRIMQDVVISELDNGQIIINNTLDAGAGATGSAVTINSDNQVVLSSVGTNGALDSLTTDAGGSTLLGGNVNTSGNQVWNDDITQSIQILYTGDVLEFFGNIDNGGFSASFNTANLGGLSHIDGDISGSGSFNLVGAGVLNINSINSMTGQVRAFIGTLVNESAATAVFPSAPVIAVEGAATTMDLGDSAMDLFEVQNGQTIEGLGGFGDTVRALSGSIVNPGLSPGDLTIDTLEMETGSTLQIELNGLTVGTEYDRVSVDTANLDVTTTGGATLEVSTGFSLTSGDQFTIIDVLSGLPVTGTFNGLAEGGTVTATDGADYTISYVGGDGNDVVLTAACSSAIEVNSIVDGGPGSLRQAVTDLCPGGTITFAADFILQLGSPLQIDKEVTIDDAMTNVVISGNDVTRVFQISSTGNLTLNQITVSNGFSNLRGGAVQNDGQLTIIDSVFSDNVTTDGATSGGAISNADGGVVVIDGSLFINNQGNRGGAIFNELAGANPAGMITITNSTFTGNGTTAFEGGAIHNGGTLISTNSTISNNGDNSTLGAGIFNFMATVNLINTIVADNGSDDCRLFGNGNTENNTANLIESGNCDAAFTDDPQLQALADNGGNTQTIALGLQSPAIDAGDDVLCTADDQRGVSRPQLNACDIGAFEQENLGIIRVDVNAVRQGPTCVLGSCWGNPYTSLQDAIRLESSSGSEIWVAAGVYYPDEGISAEDDENSESFTIPEGVAIYGGFAGNEDERNQRDHTLNITILSGDIRQDDVNTDGNNIAESVADILGQNSHHVLEMTNGSSSILDGFTITAGQAIGMGNDAGAGGLLCSLDTGMQNLVLNQNRWIGNFGTIAAGAMAGCEALISNTEFRANESTGPGGAIFNGFYTMDNVQFIDNVSGDRGGAINTGSPLTVDRGIFRGNQAVIDGGAIFNTGLDMSNSLLSGNVANGSGGAIYVQNSAQLINVTLTGNVAAVTGGGVEYFVLIRDTDSVQGDPFYVGNSIIWNNEDSTGIGTISAGANRNGFGATFFSTLFQGSGGSMSWDPLAGSDDGGNIDEDPLFLQDVNLMTVPTVDGDAHMMDDSAVVDAGSNVIVNTPLDLDGRVRIQNGNVDMGAYEGIGLLFSDGFEDTP